MIVREVIEKLTITSHVELQQLSLFAKWCDKKSYKYLRVWTDAVIRRCSL